MEEQNSEFVKDRAILRAIPNTAARVTTRHRKRRLRALALGESSGGPGMGRHQCGRGRERGANNSGNDTWSVSPRPRGDAVHMESLWAQVALVQVSS